MPISFTEINFQENRGEEDHFICGVVLQVVFKDGLFTLSLRHLLVFHVFVQFVARQFLSMLVILLVDLGLSIVLLPKRQIIYHYRHA